MEVFGEVYKYFSVCLKLSFEDFSFKSKENVVKKQKLRHKKKEKKVCD